MPALGEQTFEFYIPCVTLMGVGCHKVLRDKIKSLGSKTKDLKKMP